MTRLASLALIAGLLVGCGGATARTPTPAIPERMPAPMSGTVAGETTAFGLSGGDYRVEWTATNDSSCRLFSAWLHESGGNGIKEVASTDVPAGQTERGTANLHDVSAGRWYFEVIGRCAWTLAIGR